MTDMRAKEQKKVIRIFCPGQEGKNMTDLRAKEQKKSSNFKKTSAPSPPQESRLDPSLLHHHISTHDKRTDLLASICLSLI